MSDERAPAAWPGAAPRPPAETPVVPGERSRRAVRAAFVAILGVAVLVRVGLALASPNMLWFDEIIETLEQGHRIAFGYGLVPWEFRAGARSWLWPGALGAVMRATAPLGSGSSGYLAAVAIALSALSLVPVAAAFAWARRLGAVPALAAAAVVATWFELVYVAPKAFSEVAAGHVLVAGLLLASGAAPGRARLAAAGAALGLAVALRLQLGPAVLVAWAAVPALRAGWRWAGAGAAAVAALAGAVDWATWGAPFASYARNVRINLLEGKSREYGVLPAWAYLEMLGRVWGWWAPALLGLALVGARRRPALLAAAAVALLTHSAIPHKEWRFVYPAVLLLVVLAALGTAEVLAGLAPPGRRHRAAWVALCCAAWLGASLQRAHGFDNGRTLQGPPPGKTHWTALGHVLTVFRRASERPMCGLALFRLPWTETGGYAYLHQDVPWYEVADPAELARRGAAFDAAIGWTAPGDDLGPYRPETCVRGVCLFRRPGSCVPEPAARLERLLEARGE